jgi:hypothetical protein
MPISVAEVWASDRHVTTRNFPDLQSYMGKARTAYNDAGEAEALIVTTSESGKEQ